VALAIDASTPAIATSSVAACTTASFNPPAGSLLLVRWSGNSTSLPPQPSITDNLGAHLTYNLVDWVSAADTGRDSQAATWWALVGAGGSMTVTVTNNSSGGFVHAGLHVTVLTGQHATPIGAHGKAGSGSAAAIAQSYTAQATGGWGFIVDCDWDALGAQTAGTGCTLTNGGSGTIAGQISYGFVRRTTADDSNGGSNTLNVTLPGTSTHLSWTYAEVVPAAAAADIPWNPQRTTTVRDYGESYWIQKDRRNANLVATAANDLDEPLLQRTAQDEVYGLAAYRDRRLVPQQPNRVGDMSLFASPANDLSQPLFQPTDALYWHLYADVPLRTWRPQQRTYYDPSLLAQVATSVTYTAPRTVPPRDPGEVWFLQGSRRDPSLLTTALLENELLGGATTAQRANTPASNGPRWWMPQQPQREGYSPGLLDTALLEGPLVWIRPPQYIVARRLVPQQRAYVSDPGLLLTALLESPLVWVRPAQYVTDRRVTVQLPRYPDPSMLAPPTDPITLIGVGGDLWRRYNTPATHVDRRRTVRERPRWTVYTTADLGVGANPPIVSTTPSGTEVSQTGTGSTQQTVNVAFVSQGGIVIVSQTTGGVL
jgi:hypothetical protein